VVQPSPAGLRAILFDLDEALLSRGKAWQYAIEESVVCVSGRRVSASGLVEEYRNRPWRHALAIVLDDPDEIDRCERLAAQMFERSALKRLTVHEGLGMALDRLRGARVELGAITRERHAFALKQIQSTGLDRFLTVLSATPAGEQWDVCTRLGDCLRFIERAPEACAFVAPDSFDRRQAAGMGFGCYLPAWVLGGATDPQSVRSPADLASLLL
jgi:hypothetical protein